MINFERVTISLLDSGKFSLTQSSAGESNIDEDFLAFYGGNFFDDSLDDDAGTIDMTRCEQLLAGKYQLYGCAICVIWVLKAASKYPSLDLNELVDKLETILDGPNSFVELILSQSMTGKVSDAFIATVGYALRPRRYEIMMALSRMRGIEFEELPANDKVREELERKERLEQEKRRKLAELWANRRKK